MKVVITGGAGFLGFCIAKRLLELGEITGPHGLKQPISKLTLFDVKKPSNTLKSEETAIETVIGDVSNKKDVENLIDRDEISVFHLASVVSGSGEKNFDLAMKVNLDGGRNIMEAVRSRATCPRLIFASSIAVFGGTSMTSTVGDKAKQTPQTTYGITKAITELLINDYSRKGFLDGRSARLPHVIIRPGRPNAAASSFASAIFREPLKGNDYSVPVSPDTPMPILGYRAIVEGLIHLHELDGMALGDDRAVSLPSHTHTALEMMQAVKGYAKNRKLGKITFKPDPFVMNIINTWPLDAEWRRARQLNFPIDGGLGEIIDQFLEDYFDGESTLS